MSEKQNNLGALVVGLSENLRRFEKELEECSKQIEIAKKCIEKHSDLLDRLGRG